MVTVKKNIHAIGEWITLTEDREVGDMCNRLSLPVSRIPDLVKALMTFVPPSELPSDDFESAELEYIENRLRHLLYVLPQTQERETIVMYNMMNAARELNKIRAARAIKQ